MLLRLGEFHARDFEQLRRRASRLAFEEYVAPGRGVRISVACSRSRLRHTGAVAERVHLAIADRLGTDVPVAGADDPGHQLVLVRLVHDRCTVSLDASGELLHQRGWRKLAGKAPLRETLAAALLLASGWDRESPLADPFCGSGTIPIEAALLARRLAPGRGRRFACMDWPGFDAGGSRRARSPRRRLRRCASAPPILGSDRDAGAIDAARGQRRSGGRRGRTSRSRSARSRTSSRRPARAGSSAIRPTACACAAAATCAICTRASATCCAAAAPAGAWRCSARTRAWCARASSPLEPRARWRNGGLKVEVFTGVVPGAA